MLLYYEKLIPPIICVSPVKLHRKEKSPSFTSVCSTFQDHVKIRSVWCHKGLWKLTLASPGLVTTSNNRLLTAFWDVLTRHTIKWSFSAGGQDEKCLGPKTVPFHFWPQAHNFIFPLWDQLSDIVPLNQQAHKTELILFPLRFIKRDVALTHGSACIIIIIVIIVREQLHWHDCIKHLVFRRHCGGTFQNNQNLQTYHHPVSAAWWWWWWWSWWSLCSSSHWLWLSVPTGVSPFTGSLWGASWNKRRESFIPTSSRLVANKLQSCWSFAHLQRPVRSHLESTANQVNHEADQAVKHTWRVRETLNLLCSRRTSTIKWRGS